MEAKHAGSLGVGKLIGLISGTTVRSVFWGVCSPSYMSDDSP